MKLLLKQARVIDHLSPFNGRLVDILINDGVIESIEDTITTEADETFELNGLKVSSGWVDALSFIGEPGYEHQETLATGIKAASKGGFTGIALMPNTQPCIQGKAEVSFLKSKASDSLLNIYPLGAVSHNLEGKELTEMYDMHDAGAKAFSDGKRAIERTDLMLRALLYVKRIDATIMNAPLDGHLASGGQMNEGEESAKLGMKGVPNIAEEIMINRDIQLADYTGSKIHFSKISAAGSVDLIKAAKAKGVKVTSGVPSYQLCLDDTHVRSYDSNYKVNPVLRTKDDIAKLKQGLKDGTIEVICSNHVPKEEEAKKKEYNLADDGMTNYETCFSLAYQSLKDEMSLDAIIDKFTHGPRKVLGLDSIIVDKGAKAELTIFDESEEWSFNQSYSLAKNSPFLGSKMLGKAKYLVNKGQIETL